MTNNLHREAFSAEPTGPILTPMRRPCAKMTNKPRFHLGSAKNRIPLKMKRKILFL